MIHRRLALLSAIAAVGLLGDCMCAEPGGSKKKDDGTLPKNTDPLTTALEAEVRRLTQGEIDRTLEQLLLDATTPAARLLTRDPLTPFDNNYVDQLSSAALVEGLEALSTEVALRGLADPAARAVMIPCSPAAVDDAACFDTIAQTLGLRLLRRPLASDELTDYRELLAFARESSPYYTTGFDVAVELLVRALLMDAEFLFRIEVGTPTGEEGVVRLNPYETATRMAFALWGAGPDDALLASAAAGSLDAAADRAAVAESMLADPRARDQLARFHEQWLGYVDMPLQADLQGRMRDETAALIDRVVFNEDRDYLDLFTMEETFIDDMLADHYGVSRPTASPGWVQLGGSGRGGLLSHGTVLSSFSKVGDTSPTQRGILVRTRLMCLPVDPPPPGVPADQPPPATDNAICKEDRYAAHRDASTSCNSCHALLDPIGFGLEQYNIAGQFRTTDDGLPECVINGTGELPGYGTFSGPRELGSRLVDNGLIEPCFMQQMITQQLGRAPTTAEQGTVDVWRGRFASNGRHVKALMVDQISGEQFVTKREPADEGVQP